MLVAVVMPETSTGVVLSIMVPSPSSPLPLKPQHFTMPSVSRAHEVAKPRAISAPSTLSDNRARSRTLRKPRRGIVVDRRYVRSISKT